jgi:hypothetical protein
MMIASPTSENAPPRQCFRSDRSAALVVVGGKKRVQESLRGDPKKQTVHLRAPLIQLQKFLRIKTFFVWVLISALPSGAVKNDKFSRQFSQERFRRLC